jgi:hypothetical protein
MAGLTGLSGIGAGCLLRLYGTEPETTGPRRKPTEALSRPLPYQLGLALPTEVILPQGIGLAQAAGP